MPEPVKTSYARSLFNTISGTPSQGAGDPIEMEQRLSSPLDIGIRPYQDAAYRRAELQSGWDQLGNASMQALGEIVGGTIEGIGYLGELSGVSESVKSGEEELGNAISRFGQSIREGSREYFPVYSNAQGFSPGDWSWWMSNAPSIASSLSLMIPSGAAVGAVRTAAKAARLASKIPKGVNKTLGVLGQATVSRHMENLMEASSSYQEKLDENLKNGLKVEDARKNAAIAASSIYNRNWAMLGQDIAQYALLAGGFKGIFNKVDDSIAMAKATGKSVTPVIAKKTIGGLENMVGEGFEEGYQFVVQKEADYLAQLALDPSIESDFSDRMGEYLKDGEMWTSAFFGAFGAGVMQGTMKGINKALTKGQSLEQMRIDDIKSWGAEHSRAVRTGLVGAELGNTNVQQADYDTAVSNLFMKSASLGNLSKHREFLETMQNPSKEDLETYGITAEDAANISENSAQLLEEMDRFEKIHNKNTKRFNNNELKSMQHTLLVSRDEFLLEKTDQQYQKAENEISDISNRIVNIDKLSPTGRNIFELEAENEVLRPHISAFEALISNPNGLPDSTVQSYKDAVKQAKNKLKSNEEKIAKEKEDYTEEDKKNDKEVNLTSAAVKELNDAIANKTVLEARKNDLQDRLDKLNKGEMPYKAEPMYKSFEEIETSKEIPQRDDLVVHTNPETGEQTLGKVNKVTDDSTYTIQPLSLDMGEKVGEPIKVSVENLKLVIDSNNTDLDSDEDITDRPTFDFEDSYGMGKFIESLSYVHGDGIVRNEKLNEVLSNPETNYEGAYFDFSIDKNYKEFWDKNESLLSELNKGFLSQDRINKLTDYLINNIPVKVKVVINGTSYTKGLYLYRGDADVIRVPKHIELQGEAEINKFKEEQYAYAKGVRFNILEKLLKGEKAKVSGINVSKGSPNNVEANKNVAEMFNQDANNIRLGVGDRSGMLTEGDNEYTIQVGKGRVYAMTNKTCNGDEALIKLNKAMLSEEHADILFEAIRQFYNRKGGGYQSKLKDDRVEGLTTGQVMEILALMGERQTSVDHADNVNRLGEGMRNKQLFVKPNEKGKLVLHYGNNTMEFMSNKKGVVEENKKKFIEWATANKPYSVKFQSDKLGLNGMNGTYIKTFKLGSMSHDGKSSYASMLIKNNIVTTDVQEFTDGSVTNRPVVKFDASTLTTDVKKAKKETKVVPKKTKEIINKTKESDNTYKIESAEDLQHIPVGAEMFHLNYEFDENGNKIGTNYMFGTVIDLNGQPTFQIKDSLVNSEEYKKLHNVALSDPKFVSQLNEMGIPVTDLKSSLLGTEHQKADIKPEVVEETSDIEAKKADIERRRQEELKKERKSLDKGLERLNNLLNKKNLPDNEEDAVKILNEIIRFRKNAPRGATKEELSRLEQLESYIKDKFGLTVESKLGKKYDTGDRVKVDFQQGSSEEENFTYVNEIKPQINKDGVLVQPGEYVVLQYATQDEISNALKPREAKVSKINAKYDSELASLKTKEEVKEQQPIKEGKITANDIIFEDDEDIFREIASEEEYEVQNLKKELRKVRNMLGSRVSGDFQQVDKLIDVINSGRKAFAQYRHDVIKIYNQAERGTSYHEAFHRVELAYLTQQERDAIYESARQEFSLRGISDREVSEFLAEKWRDYVLARENVNLGDRIKNFFKRLYNHIRSFFVGDHRLTSYEVDKLFEDIYLGRYRNNKLLAENNTPQLQDRQRSVYGTEFESIDTMDTLRSLIKSLTYELIKLNKYTDFDNLSNKTLSHKPLVKKIENHIQKHKDALNQEGLTKAEENLLRQRLNLYTDVLGYNETTKQYDNFSTIYELIFDFLDSMDLNPHVLKDNDPDMFNDEADNLSIGEFDKQSFEISPKHNSQANVKMLIALLPTVNVKKKEDGKIVVKRNKNKITGLGEFVDYNETWDTLLGDLYHYNNINDMITRLKELSSLRPEYYTLVKRLEDNKDGILKQQFEATMRKNRNSFINATFEVGKDDISVNFSDADTKKVSNMKLAEWNLDFYRSDKVNRNIEYPVINQDFKNDLSKTFNDIKSKLLIDSKIPNFNQKISAYYDDVKSLLSSLYIDIDDRTLDYFCESGKNDNVTNFVNFVTKDLNTIVENVIIQHNPKNHASKLYQDQAVRRIANGYAKSHPEEMSNMVLGPNNASYYSYSNHSNVTSLIRDLKLNPEIAADMLKNRFVDTSKFLSSIALNKNVRDTLEVVSFAGIFANQGGDKGRDYFGMNAMEDYLIKLHANHRGLVSFPTIADKKTYYFLRGLETIDVTFDQTEDGQFTLSDDTIDELYKQVQGEYDRITKARAERDLLISFRNNKQTTEADNMFANMVENYHHVKGDLNKGNAYDFVAFKGLSYDNFDEDTVKEQIKVAVNNLVKKELQYAGSLGIVTFDENGNYSAKHTIGKQEFKTIDKEVLGKLTKEYGSESNAIKALFTEHVVKNIDNDLELHKMFIGDPAFYKADKKTGSVEVDLGKRLGELIASGEEMSLQVPNQGEELMKKDFNVSTIQSQPLKSAYYEDLLDIYKERIGEKKAKELLKPYTELEQADGQAFITPAMYRSISIRIGEWSPKKQEAYELLTSDRELTLEEENKSLNIVLNPLKTVYFGFDYIKDIAVPTYDKMSMAPLFRKCIKGMQIEQLLDRMEAKGQYEGLNKIDMVKMDSATKVGNRGAKPLFADEYQSKFTDLSQFNVHTQQFKNLRRQTPTPTHEAERTNIGTQFLKIAMSNLNFNDPVYELNGKKTGKQIADIINTCLTSLSKYGKQNIDVKFGVKDNVVDKSKLAETMRKEAKSAGMPMSTVDSIKESEGEMYQTPDAMPNRKWFESRFISLVTKEVIDRKMPGGQFVQVSNLGFRKIKSKYDLKSEDDRVTWLREDTTDIPFVHKVNGELQSMGCAVSVSLFKQSIPDYDKKKFEEKVQFIKDNDLDVLGYRIPTQGQNSTVVMRVVGLLPDEAGDTIIFPSEFVGLTGSDFDIDKLFLVRKNMSFDRDGKVKYVDFITDDNQRAYDNMAMYLFSLYKNILGESFLDEYYNKQSDIIERGRNIPQLKDDIAPIIEKIDSLKLIRDGVTDKNERAAYTNEINEQYDKIAELKKLYNLDGVYDFREMKAKDRKELLGLIKSELVQQGHLPKFNDFKKLNNFEKNVPAAIENYLIDAYKSVLTSDEHLLNTTAPLGGLTDRLKDMANTVRELYEEGDDSIMSMFTPRAHSQSKFKYSSGKAGIGPFALHNSHHVLTQISQYAIQGGVSRLQLYKELGEHTVLDLAQKVGSDGVNILDWLSALIDAHVDLAKDPYIMDLNVNPFTYDIAGYLIRTGVGEQTFKYLSMEGIRMASSLFMSTRKSIFRRNALNTNSIINTTVDRILSKAGISNYEDIAESVLIRKEDLLKEGDQSIENNMFKGDKIKRDMDYWIDQIAALELLKDIKDEAALLTQDVQSTQIDARKYGKTLMEIESFMSKIMKSHENSQKGKTIGYEKLVPYDKDNLYTEPKEDETFIAGYYRNGLARILELYSDITINSTKVFRDAVYEILELSGRTNPTTEQLTQAANELYSALVGKYVFADSEMGFGITPGNLQYMLFREGDSIYDRFIKLKTKYPDLFKDNKFLNRLDTVFDQNLDIQKYFYHKNTAFKDTMEANDVIYAWEDLLKHDDKQINTLARHLFLYSFYTTGFNNTINGFNSLIPPSMMKAMNVGERTISMDVIMKGLLNRMKSDSFKEDMKDIIADVLSHQHYDPQAFNSVKFMSIPLKGNKIYTTMEDGDAYIGMNSNKIPIFSPYIKRNKQLFKLRGVVVSPNGDKPIYTLENRRGYRERGRFVHQYGLKGTVLSTNNESDRVETITKEIKADLEQRFGGQYVQYTTNDLYFNRRDEYVVDSIEPVTNTDNMIKYNKLSSEAKPLEVYVDGSAIKQKEQFGSGAYLSYNGTPYGISNSKTSEDIRKEFNISDKEFDSYKKENKTFSNGVMETYAIYDVLKSFADTNEHLVIYSDGNNSILQIKNMIQDVVRDTDYNGEDSVAYGSGDNIVYYKDSKGNKTNNIHSRYINVEIVKLIRQIQNNGGSVELVKVLGHAGIEGNELADKSAKSTTVKNSMNDLLSLRTVDTSNLTPMSEALKKLEEMNIVQGELFPLEATPENITSLKPNEVFVFGSNEGSSKGGKPTHGRGAALTARQKFGAIQGQARGLQGQSYAIVTKKYWDVEKSSTLEEIQNEINIFNEFAKKNTNKKFYVTKIGASLAGYSLDQIAQLFENLGDNISNNIVLPEEYEYRAKKYCKGK